MFQQFYKKTGSYLTIGILGLMLLGGTSCTREYICECKISYEGQPGLPDPTVKEYKVTNTRAEAESLCKNKSATYQNNGITTKEECDLW